MSNISISLNGVWAGNGHVNAHGQIEDCAAVLGDSREASEATYVAIEDAIESGASEGSVERPDGVYSWIID